MKKNVDEPLISGTSVPESGSRGGFRHSSIAQYIASAVDIQAQISALQGEQALLIDEGHRFAVLLSPVEQSRQGWSPEVVAVREYQSELAVAMRLSERAIENLAGEGRALVECLPSTMAALREGTISYRHAKTIIDHTSGLDEPQMASFEASLLGRASTESVAKFERSALSARERLFSETIEQRAVKAAKTMYVTVTPEPDGMATLHAYLPAPEAYGIANRLTDIAHAIQRESAEKPADTSSRVRGIARLRAQTLVDLLLNGIVEPDDVAETPGRARGIRARVAITVPVMRMLGSGNEVPTLEGYGPIDMETAKRLMGTATHFMRVLTHPETGVILSVGRDRYKIPRGMATVSRLRDDTCTFMNCNKPATTAQLDHCDEWQYGGQTRHDNLTCLCEEHHRLKSYTRWKNRKLPDGSTQWVSPTGAVYVREAARKVSFVDAGGDPPPF